MLFILIGLAKGLTFIRTGGNPSDCAAGEHIAVDADLNSYCVPMDDNCLQVSTESLTDGSPINCVECIPGWHPDYTR